MIHITCVYPGILHVSGFKSGDCLTVDSAISIEDFLLSYGIEPSHLKHIVPIVNGKDMPMDYYLQDNDTLKLYIPVGGG